VEGTSTTIQDVVMNLNHVHLAQETPTLFETTQDAGLSPAAINYLIYRGRTRHTMKHGWLAKVGRRVGVEAVYGPQYFYWGELYGSMRPLLPQVGIKRPKDWSASHVARWIIRNTSSRFMLLYLGQHDYASHKAGPEGAVNAIRVADRALGRTIEALGGFENVRDHHSLIICADHGQTPVDLGKHERLEDAFDGVELFRGSRIHDTSECDLAISPSCRFAMAYRLHAESPGVSWIGETALKSPATDLVAYADAEHGQMIVKTHGGGELHIRRSPDGIPTTRSATDEDGARWIVDGDLSALEIEMSDGMLNDWGAYPDALARLDASLRCVNSGDVLISARPGYEYTDIGGGKHSGGSHGSLTRQDSLAPLMTYGVDRDVVESHPRTMRRLADIAPMVLKTLGVERS
jgi:hypothetical protein